jgi:glycerol-3-phosphate O-acyltransferase
MSELLGLPESIWEKLRALPPKEGAELALFMETYLYASPSGDVFPLLECLAEKVALEIASPREFEAYHVRERAPFDYYQFGLDLIAPLIDLEKSRRLGLSHLEQAEQYVLQKENVIFVANHQIEPDPQVISLLLAPKWSRFSEGMIFVAGHRVVQDPLAKPFSRGRDLLSIYSKKYILEPPEEKEMKQQHNQKTLAVLQELLDSGGKAIYVAMAGGRDRPDGTGHIRPGPFDPNSLELFSLISKEAKRKTHFFPLALATYAIFPPPDTRQKELGEPRRVSRAAAHIAFGKELIMDELAPHGLAKKKAREVRAETVTSIVRDLYRLFPS